MQTAVDDARAEGADYVFVMGHLGNEAECEPWTYADVIRNTSGIDVFLDGHSHDTDQIVMQDKDGNDVIRSACGTKLQGIGYARISAADGSIEAGVYSWNNDVSVPELLGVTNSMSEAVEKGIGELDEKLQEVVAKSAVDLVIYDPTAADADGNPIRIVRRTETNLGDLCADAARDQSGADIAFVNGGSIRVSIEKGDITFGNILAVHPFGSMLCVLEVTGQQILDALEWSCRSVPDENGGFNQVSGLTFEINSAIDSPCKADKDGMCIGIEGERRVQNVMVGGEALDPEKTYTLAGYDYQLRQQGDGYTAYDGAPVLQDNVKLDNQVLIDYIVDTLGGNVGGEYADPYGEGRITILE